MKAKQLVFVLLSVLMSSKICAQKEMYIPQEWQNRTDTLIWAESDPDNKYTWSLSRSAQSDNFIVLWDKAYGNTAPNKLSTSNFYYVDIDDLLSKCESFFKLETQTLGFADAEKSNLSKYKILVLLNHTTEWTCYGAGYDFSVPAIWLNPETCKPIKAEVAHEVGHAFQYMCYSEASSHGELEGVETGFISAVGNGQSIWETTANWQALQSFPDVVFSESGTGDVFADTHNYAFSHEWHRYQSYMFLIYLTEHFDDIQTIAKVWNYPMSTPSDFNQVLMVLKEMDANELYRLYFDFAMHCVTYDMSFCEPYREPYIGNFNYRCSLVADSTYQVALASCPQSTGFNAIPLQLAEAGTEVVSYFTALPTQDSLASSDPATYYDGESFVASSRKKYNKVSVASDRGFRLGYVVLLDDDSRVYLSSDSIYCPGNDLQTVEVSAIVPEHARKMWLIVSPAPKNYIQHRWDDKLDKDDMWPYLVRFSGTDIDNRAIVYADPTLDGRGLGNIVFNYEVSLAVDDVDYTGTTLTVSGSAAAQLCTALQLSVSDISSRLVDYRADGPSAGEVMFYPSDAEGTLVESGSTANGYGHWFDADGKVCSWGTDARLFSELRDPASLSFYIGQYPGKCQVDDSFIIAQALRYRRSNTEEAKAVLVFHVTMADQNSVKLLSVDYDEETALSVRSFSVDNKYQNSFDSTRIYSVDGRMLSKENSSGLYIEHGRKIVKP